MTSSPVPIPRGTDQPAHDAPGSWRAGPAWQHLGLLALALGCAACRSEQPGIAVELTAVHHPGAPDGEVELAYQAGEQRGFINTEGFGVVLERVLVVVGRVELLPCDDASSLWRHLKPLLPLAATAHAHGKSGPLVVAVPHVLDLTGHDRQVLSLTQMRPPPGEYCALKLDISPTDADGVGLPDDVELAQRSLFVEGTVVQLDSLTEHELLLHSEFARSRELPFVDIASQPTRIQLAATMPAVEVQIDFNYGRMLDGIDFAADDPALVEFRMIDNLLSHAQAIVHP